MLPAGREIPFILGFPNCVESHENWGKGFNERFYNKFTHKNIAKLLTFS